MLDRRAFARAAAAFAATPFLTACQGGRSEGGEADGVDHDRSCLHFRISNPVSLDPFSASSESALQVVMQIFDTLTYVDAASGEVRGLASQSFEMSDDARQFTFRLRGGQTFHDGSALRAEDFKRSWERLVSPSSSAAAQWGESAYSRLLALVEGYSELASGVADALSGVSCPDELTLLVRLQAPYADLPMLLSHPALCAVPAAADDDPEAFALNPIGSGPYKISGKWDGKGDIDLESNESYAGGAASVKSVRLAVTSDATSGFKLLEAGDLDVCEVPVDRLETARETFAPESTTGELGEAGRFLSRQGTTVYYLLCNLRTKPFDSLEFRRAVSISIDRESLCEKGLRGAFSPAQGLASPALAIGGVDGDAIHPWQYCTYDYNQAESLFETVYPSRKDGSREASVALLYSSGGIESKIVESLSSDLKAQGLEFKPEAIDAGGLADRLREGTFSCALLSWTPDFPALDQIAHPILHGSPRGALNFGGYSDGDVDAALDEARSTADAAARADLVCSALDRASSACPVIPLVHTVESFAASSCVARLRIDCMGRSRFAEAELEE